MNLKRIKTSTGGIKRKLVRGCGKGTNNAGAVDLEGGAKLRERENRGDGHGQTRPYENYFGKRL